MPPIQFEEITGQIERDPQTRPGGEIEPPESAPTEDLGAQLDRELRLRAERSARLSAD